MSDTQIDEMATKLSVIVAYIDQLSELDTSKVSPTVHPVSLQNVFRADEEGTSFGTEVSLSNAPQRERDCFRVPKIVSKRA